MRDRMENLLGDGGFLLGGVALGMVLVGMFWLVYNFTDLVTVPNILSGIGICIGLGLFLKALKMLGILES